MKPRLYNTLIVTAAGGTALGLGTWFILQDSLLTAFAWGVALVCLWLTK